MESGHIAPRTRSPPQPHLIPEASDTAKVIPFSIGPPLPWPRQVRALSEALEKQHRQNVGLEDQVRASEGRVCAHHREPIIRKPTQSRICKTSAPALTFSLRGKEGGGDWG